MYKKCRLNQAAFFYYVDVELEMLDCNAAKNAGPGYK